MCLLAVNDVRKGRDPKHIVRDPEKNRIIYVRGEDTPELV